jgi:hypothetical protein
MDSLSNFLQLDEKDRSDAMQLLGRLMSFDYSDDRQRAYLDSMTALDYCKRLGLSDNLTYRVFGAFLEMGITEDVDKSSILGLGMIVQFFGHAPRDMMKFNMFVNPPTKAS